MTQLTHWIPERWRDNLATLRDELYDIAERWRPHRHDQAPAGNGNIPVRYDSRNETAEHLGFWSPSVRLTRSLAIDLDETDDDVVVTADMPGLDPEDLAVEVTDRRLVIRGENTPVFRPSRRRS